VSGSDDHTVRVWDLATDAPVGEPLAGHTNSVTSPPAAGKFLSRVEVPSLPNPPERICQWRIRLSMKTMTTIRVDQAVRDRLAALTEAHGRSLGAEFVAILDDLQVAGN